MKIFVNELSALLKSFSCGHAVCVVQLTLSNLNNAIQEILCPVLIVCLVHVARSLTK